MTWRFDWKNLPWESSDSLDDLHHRGWQDAFQSPAEFRKYVREFSAAIAPEMRLIDKARIRAERILQRWRL